MNAEIPAGDVAALRTDDELLAAARQGDDTALEALLLRYQPHLYRFGLRMCDFRGDSSVSTWLYTIARRFCIKKRRRTKFAPRREESLDAPGNEAVQRLTDPAPDPEHAAAGREVEAALAAAIGALDERQREVLVLRDVLGVEPKEACSVIGVSDGNHRVLLHRARAKVRAALERHFAEEAAP
jgi:RNA polymerase sigma-70 factor (ECF subfamily)